MITFRKIEEKDEPFIQQLYRSTREKELDQTNWPEPQKHMFIVMQLIAQLADYEKKFKDAHYLLILYKKELAGRLYRWESEREIRIIDMSLLPSFQGKGIGKDILSSIVKEAQQKKKVASLYVTVDHPAKKMYERVGFKKVGSTLTHEYMEA